MISNVLGALILSSLLTAPAPQPVVLEIDCDAGQSLERALRRVRKAPGARIFVRGTCVGNFVLTTDGVRIDGVSPTESILMAPPDGNAAPVLDVRNATGVVVARLGVRGGAVGVNFFRSPDGTVIESEIDTNEQVGISFRESLNGTVYQSLVHHNDIGVNSTSRSSVSVQLSEIRDNGREGLSAFNYSTLVVGNSRVAGNGQVGAVARIVSGVNVIDSSFAENGEVHVYASDRSRMQLVSGVVLGGEGDSTQVAAGVQNDSSLHSGTLAEFHGDIYATGDSYLELGNVDVRGRIRAQQFSRVVLFRTELALPAECVSGADLVCTGSATADTVDCPSGPTSCSSPSTSSPPTTAEEPPLPELRRTMRRLDDR